MAIKIRKGDTVQVLGGKDRGRQGKVLSVHPKDLRLVVEGLNIRKKFNKARREGERGQIVEFPASLPISRVALVCPSCKKPIRVAYRHLADGKKERRCRKCDAGITVS
ncbi:50S ribosomal protein L24 [Candidatus Uhrbacteria bacterium CG10_big_fil_rev_8_21_14_0_10_48_11]|uniref:Large ribosomal subunit protein uL24 n=1 Tax=Candidatus Uhrbacteria bacterium CG10_big_fil_rev_8_21_14_0_10_48_11 TaxID=1975037 RepID=A0A2M8LEZ3_9BACT|nr:MAG: 50S ribosomal protein L24 [Candidatus Uhrbacteria bacterium CG10_big_fil_rev_8_21_14_0_10_48_11]